MQQCRACHSLPKVKRIQGNDLKKEKHEKMLDTVAKSVGDLLLSVLIFGGMAVALYYGSI